MEVIVERHIDPHLRLEVVPLKRLRHHVAYIDNHPQCLTSCTNIWSTSYFIGVNNNNTFLYFVDLIILRRTKVIKGPSKTYQGGEGEAVREITPKEAMVPAEKLLTMKGLLFIMRP